MKKLALNKKTISILEMKSVKGGFDTSAVVNATKEISNAQAVDDSECAWDVDNGGNVKNGTNPKGGC